MLSTPSTSDTTAGQRRKKDTTKIPLRLLHTPQPQKDKTKKELYRIHTVWKATHQTDSTTPPPPLSPSCRLSLNGLAVVSVRRSPATRAPGSPDQKILRCPPQPFTHPPPLPAQRPSRKRPTTQHRSLYHASWTGWARLGRGKRTEGGGAESALQRTRTKSNFLHLAALGVVCQPGCASVSRRSGHGEGSRSLSGSGGWGWGGGRRRRRGRGRGRRSWRESHRGVRGNSLLRVHKQKCEAGGEGGELRSGYSGNHPGYSGNHPCYLFSNSAECFW